MADDGTLKDHQTRLAYLQPEGLADSQVVLDRAQLVRIQQDFLPFTTDAEIEDKPVSALRSLLDFLREFLGMAARILARYRGGPAAP